MKSVLMDFRFLVLATMLVLAVATVAASWGSWLFVGAMLALCASVTFALAEVDFKWTVPSFSKSVAVLCLAPAAAVCGLYVSVPEATNITSVLFAFGGVVAISSFLALPFLMIRLMCKRGRHVVRC